MATDSTELTIVRCPSCRSLVPAVSTRCRMCGATLDTSQARPEESEVKRSGRVRQRTMMQPESELMDAAEKVRGEMSGSDTDFHDADNHNGSSQSSHEADTTKGLPAEKAGGAADVQSPAFTGGLPEDASVNMDPDLEADPLSAYIEEVTVEELESSGSAEQIPEQEEKTQPADERFPWEMLDEELGQSSIEPVEEPPASAVPSPSVPASVLDSPHELTTSGSPPARSSVSANVEKRDSISRHDTSEKAPRVIVESGSRKGNRPSGLSFGKPRSEPGRHGEQAPRPERGRQDQRPAESRQHEPRHDEQRRTKDRSGESPRRPERDHRQDRDQRNERLQHRERPRGDQPFRDKPSNRGGPHPSSSFGGVGEEPHAEGDATGSRLVGWLVSFGNADGVARELREGKFFVTQTSLKEQDLILDHDSISTPHALIVVSLRDGVRVQDLMSDRGVFLKKRKSDAFQRLTETTVIGHGEWVRFGEVEFLVSLVPYSDGGH